jgi:hypothetical protein
MSRAPNDTATSPGSQALSGEVREQTDLARFAGKRNRLGVKERQRRNKAEWAPRLKNLGVGWAGLAVMLDMGLGRFRCVVHCVFVVTAGQVCVVCCRFVLACFVVFCGFLVMSCGEFVMLCRLMMVLCCLL